MDPDIQFGEIEHAAPQVHLRPDRNRHLAVVPVYQPAENELLIYVDLDAMREMEFHALSDTRVELGGVLLGGQFADESGRQFVVVTDCLRAQHYESTKGSFKFTHDTWEQITRERDDFPADLQMVGWYHTHPDWGVFLSGLDMFICENFFNKQLDVALVIDPCRQDRGFFQWTDEHPRKCRRTEGFYLIASRFRSLELNAYAAQLEAKFMTHDPRHPSPVTSYPQPVVHVAPTAGSAPQTLAILGMLSLQFCFLMLIAWRLLLPLNDGSNSPELAGIKESVDQLSAARQRESEIDAKLQVLEMVVRQGSNAPAGVLKSLAEQTALSEELRSNLRAQQSLSRELDGKATELANSLSDANRQNKQQQNDLAGLEARIADLNAKLDESTSRLALAEDRADADGLVESDSWWSAARANSKSIGLGAVLGALVIGAALAVAQRVRKTSGEQDNGVSDDNERHATTQSD